MNNREKKIQMLIREARDEFGYRLDENHPKLREYAELMAEDLNRKGCIDELDTSGYCLNCVHMGKNDCPLCTWQRRHPEFVNDELTQKIKALEQELKNL
jgi:hypothetical protein